MLDTIIRHLEGVSAQRDRKAVRSVVSPIGDRLSSQCLVQAEDIVITSGGAATAKTGSADAYFVANGVIVKITASTTLPALAGTITATAFNVFCFFIDQGGVVTSAIGTEGATLALVKFPQFPQARAYVGALIVTHSSTFTGGTTPLDTATTVYITASTGAFDPTVLVGG